uniref:Major facilitator superfamily (MFS) profile domain-containing protein n=1 Tax=Oxyrrhis marina TaxID=2969 RepID=A0A7S4GKV5_OXYMA|mmetsp:Transcript_39874/g.95700  ORF Transcript_39874/g.95700 Transcript_39874/m.95700 type:complete len:447 (-) Transcript_39874:136-1476(-)
MVDASSPGLPVPAGRGQPVRWLVLTVMFWLGLTQTMAWMTFTGNPDIFRSYYRVSKGSSEMIQDWLLNAGPITYLPMAPLVAGLTNRIDRVWSTVLAGAALTAAGTIVRLLPSAVGMSESTSITVLAIGQALNGFAGPMNAVTPPIIAAIWFPPEERTLATSIVFSIQAAGPALGFLLALLVTTQHHFTVLLVGEAILGVTVTLAWMALPKLPRIPPSISQGLRGAGAVAAASTPVTRRQWVSFACLMTAGGLLNGVFQGWSNTIPTQLEGVLPGALLKWFSFIAGMACVIGSLTVAVVTRVFKLECKLKLTLLCTISLQFAGFTLFTVLLPGSPPAGVSASGLVLMFLIVLGSVANGAMSPLVYELGAEISYPSSEGLSGGVFSWLLNAFALVLLVVLPLVPSTMDGQLMAATCLLGAGLVAVVQERYGRQEADRDGVLMDGKGP